MSDQNDDGSLSPECFQTRSAMRTVGLLHGEVGIPVLPEGANLRGRDDIRVFPLLLAHPEKLAATCIVFSAAENAINSPTATLRCEAVMPLIDAAVRQASAECGHQISGDQREGFLRILTSTELHDEAA